MIEHGVAVVYSSHQVTQGDKTTRDTPDTATKFKDRCSGRNRAMDELRLFRSWQCQVHTDGTAVGLSGRIARRGHATDRGSGCGRRDQDLRGASGRTVGLVVRNNSRTRARGRKIHSNGRFPR